MTPRLHPWGDEHDDGAPARVLLVDDDDLQRLLTSTALRTRGLQVTEVGSGEAALELLRRWTPDLVMLDALMPGMDGFDTCRRLRSLPGGDQLPVLMLTGLDDEASIESAYDAGANDFFVKSTQWSLLLGRVRNLLRSARTHRELLFSRAKLARAQDLARMGSFDWRPMPRGLHLEPEALRVLGRSPREAMGLRQALRTLVGAERQGLAALLREVLRHGTVLDTDATVALPDGRRRILHIEAEPEFNEQGALDGYTGVLQDVTDRRLIEDKIKHLANFDSLTGLPNRRQLLWRAERALDHARRRGHGFALLLIDLDRFKGINDSLGHSAGDELLVEIGERLRACLCDPDGGVDLVSEVNPLRGHHALEAVGRLGGDEFVALLPEVANEHEAEHFAQRLLQVTRAPVLLAGQEYFVTASVGVALYPRDGLTVVDLLRNADVAMYSVKSAGRNDMQVYRPHLSGMGRHKLELESALHKALERGELVLHYQPKVDVGANRVAGVEALMRWRRGGILVQPSNFIPLAEETGLIVPMSEWAIREAMRQIASWRDQAGLALNVAINLPSRAFERTDLIDHLQRASQQHAVSLASINLEITETGLMKDLEGVIPALHRLTQSGVGISIDDFGTGYSSLAYLTQLPISEVKIDRSFVNDLGVTEQSGAVVSAIIALARSLRLRVIAEGVENVHQREVLSQLGCQTMQGYLFARPLPAEALPGWLQGLNGR